jgi:hypothetical protein
MRNDCENAHNESGLYTTQTQPSKRNALETRKGRPGMAVAIGIGGAVTCSPLPHHRRVRIRRFSKLSPCGPEVRVIVRHRGFAALQVAVSASPSSEPVKLSRG